MNTVTFNDLLEIRKGGEELTLGGGESRIEGIRTAEEWHRKADALLEIFQQTLGQPPEDSAPLPPEVLEEVDCGDYFRRTVAYDVGPDERIRAYVLVPRNLKSKAPAVLGIHGTTPLGKEKAIGNDHSEKGQDCAYALHLVGRGYVTFAFDLLGAGERCYPGLGDFDTAPFYERYPGWSVRGKDLWDVSRAIDVLETIDEVDSERIGSIGNSQGGGITVHSMVVDRRIVAGVSSCGVWPYRLSKNPFNHARTGWWVGRPFLRPYCTAGKPFPIDLHEYLALIAPRAIMNIVALNDWGYTLEEQETTRAAFADLVENVDRVFSLLDVEGRFENVLHTNGHGFDREQRDVAYAFIDRHLKTKDE